MRQELGVTESQLKRFYDMYELFSEKRRMRFPRFRYFPFPPTYPATSSDLSRLFVVETDINADLLTETETILDALSTPLQRQIPSEKVSLFFRNNNKSRMSLAQDRMTE